jgi:hypothetical protein
MCKRGGELGLAGAGFAENHDRLIAANRRTKLLSDGSHTLRLQELVEAESLAARFGGSHGPQIFLGVFDDRLLGDEPPEQGRDRFDDRYDRVVGALVFGKLHVERAHEASPLRRRRLRP